MSAARYPVLFVAFIVVAIPSPGFVEVAVAQTADQIGGPSADVNCPNFISEADANAVYRAAGGPDVDTYDLDDDGAAEDGIACNSDRTELNGPTLATCANFHSRRHAQALYRAASDDPYGLDPDGNERACDGATAPNPTPRPTPSPTSNQPTSSPRPITGDTGCDSTLVSNGRITICSGQGIQP